MSPGARLQALYPGALDWTTYEVVSVTDDRVRVRDGVVEFEFLTADVLAGGSGPVRLRIAETEPEPVLPVPAGGWRCSRCREPNDYQSGPFTCWQCRQNPYR